MHNLYPYRASDCIVFKLHVAWYTYMHMACRCESGGMAGGTGTENVVSEMCLPRNRRLAMLHGGRSAYTSGSIHTGHGIRVYSWYRQSSKRGETIQCVISIHIQTAHKMTINSILPPTPGVVELYTDTYNFMQYQW